MTGQDSHQLWLRAYLALHPEVVTLLKMDAADFLRDRDRAYAKGIVRLARHATSLLQSKQTDFTEDELIHLLAYIQLCEGKFDDLRNEDFEDYFEPPYSAWDGHDYIALGRPKLLLRAATPETVGDGRLKKMPGSAECQASATLLKTRYIWIKTRGPTGLSYGREEALTWLRELDQPIRIGVASWLHGDQVDFALTPHPVGGNAHWARCTGAKDAAAVQKHMEAVVASAISNSVNVLLFPELTVNESLLEAMQTTLDGIADAHTVFLVVAGSAHAGVNGEIYVNRTTALNGLGQILWSQDKCATFDIVLGGVHYYEPSKLGAGLCVRESDTLGRLALIICSDFCNASLPGNQTPLFRLLQMTRPSLTLVPTMQHDGNLQQFSVAAGVLQGSHWGATVVGNIRVPENPPKTGLAMSSLVWPADSRGLPGLSPAFEDSMVYLQFFDLRSISTQDLVNYKEGR